MTGLEFFNVIHGGQTEGLPLLEQNLKRIRGKQGLDHPNTLLTMCVLASAYLEARRKAEALALLEESLKLLKAKVGAEYPYVVWCSVTLAAAYIDAEKLSECEVLCRELLTSERKNPTAGGVHVGRVLALLGGGLLAQGKYQEAEPVYRQALDILETRYRPTTWCSLSAILWA